jgi:hypothetical protein
MSDWRIKQIIPAEGWFSAHRIDEGFWFEPLACWAIINPNDPLQVKEILVGCSASDIAGDNCFYPHAGNFAGYCHSNDFSELGVALKQGVKPRNNMGS